MSLQVRLSQAIEHFAKEHHLIVTQKDFLYAGPCMRMRHTLVLAFTDAGLFTFTFHLSEGQMHYLAKESLQKIEIIKKKRVCSLKIIATEEGKTEEVNYLVSKRVFGRKWHKETLEKLTSLKGGCLFSSN